MRVRGDIGYLLLIGIAIVAFGAVLAVAWFYLYLAPMMANKKVETEVLRMQASAFLYRGRLGIFNGVCSDIGVRSGYVCNESEKEFAVEGRLSDGSYYCADSTGFADKKQTSVRDTLSCNR